MSAGGCERVATSAFPNGSWQQNISCEAIFDGFSHAFYKQTVLPFRKDALVSLPTSVSRHSMAAVAGGKGVGGVRGIYEQLVYEVWCYLDEHKT